MKFSVLMAYRTTLVTLFIFVVFLSAGNSVARRYDEITINNVSELVEVQRWGRAYLHDVSWSASTQTWALSSVSGVHIFTSDFTEELMTIPEEDGVQATSFSPDGELLAFTENMPVERRLDSFPVYLWDMVENQLLHVLEGRKSIVTNISFSSDSLLVASGSFHQADIGVNLWDVRSGQRVFTFDGKQAPFAFSPQDSLITLRDRNKVEAWNYETNELVMTLDHFEEQPTHLEFSSDGSTLLSVAGGTVYLWDVETGEQKASLEGSGATFAPQSSLLAFIDSSFFINIYDYREGDLKLTSSQPFCGSTFKFDDQSSMLAIANLDGSVYLWDLDSDQPERVLEGDFDPVINLSFDQEDNFLAVGTSALNAVRAEHGTSTRVWNVENGEDDISIQSDIFDFIQAAFDPNNELHAIGTDQFGEVFWDFKDEQAIIEGTVNRISTNFAFSTASQKLATIQNDKFLYVYDLETGTELYSQEQEDSIRRLSFSRSGDFLAVADRVGNTSVLEMASDNVREVATLALPETFPSPGAVAFGSNEDTLVVATNKIYFIDLQAGLIVRTIDNTPWDITGLVYAEEEDLVITGDIQGNMKMWSADDGQLIRDIPVFNSAINSVELNHSETMIALGGQNGILSLWGIPESDN